MKPLLIQQRRIEVLDLVAIGSVVLTAAAFLYPIVSPQVFGLLGVGAIGTKVLLVLPGLLFLVAGLILSTEAGRTTFSDARRKP